VIVVWSTPKQVLMIALNLDGEEKWRRDLGPFRGLHGSASSPIIALVACIECFVFVGEKLA
jgi:hypothetical protein